TREVDDCVIARAAAKVVAALAPADEVVPAPAADLVGAAAGADHLPARGAGQGVPMSGSGEGRGVAAATPGGEGGRAPVGVLIDVACGGLGDHCQPPPVARACGPDPLLH